jgi:hypothetical protein
MHALSDVAHNEPFRMRFRSNFQRLVAEIEYSHPLKVLRKRILKGSYHLYAPQAKILEGGTKDEIQIFD